MQSLLLVADCIAMGLLLLWVARNDKAKDGGTGLFQMRFVPKKEAAPPRRRGLGRPASGAARPDGTAADA